MSHPTLHPLEIDALAHRVLYYVWARPILTDFEYDQLEAKARAATPPDSLINTTVGSDLLSSYPHEAKMRALTLWLDEVERSGEGRMLRS